MAENAAPSWSLRGEYFENCNCAVTCPCLFSPNPPLSSMPTEGACEVAFAFHLDEGAYGDVRLDGLNLAMIARTPGPMGEGNWAVALYLDERADERQQQGLQAIFSGVAGGVMGALAPLIGSVLGVKNVPIDYRREGKRRSVAIPDVMQLAVRPVPSIAGADAEIVATNAHPFAPEGVVMAVGDEGSVWSDYGMRWDNSGRNGHYAPIAWSNR
ncbi:MAG: DUF1326 domain-containing protein [Thermomicrobiales bacterium]|nr:DUF1326 domain-containing protein [Thermomicrobiales bacterium]